MLLSLMLLAVAALNRSPAEAQPHVTIKDGALAGRYLDQSGAEFLGIPYAAPPVGALRWRAPQPVAEWRGVRQATRYGPACPQLPSGWLPEMLGRRQMETSEACLYLNVWTPRLRPEAKLPVMVWIHGGGNVEGSQEWPALGPALARRGVVVVTINYRLGVLGYLAHPELSRESPHHVSGNYGLLDQMAALQWVQRNIAAFGGDRRRVTVFGASSGSLDVCDLMASPLARGLFAGAIMQSGVCVDSLARTQPEAEKVGRRIAGDLAPGHADDLTALRALPADTLVRKSAAEADADFNPIVDGWALAEQPAVAFAQGRQARVPVIVGSNADEVSIFASPLVGGTSSRPKTVSDYRKWLADEYGAHADAVFAAYPAATDDRVPAAFLAMDTDAAFGFGANLLACEVARSGERAYLYHFTYVGRGPFAALGAFHSEESMFLSQRYWSSWVADPKDARLSTAIIGYWVAFAKTGRPEHSGLPTWAPYDPARPMAQELGARVGPMAVPRLEQMRVFEEMLEASLPHPSH